MPKSGSIDLSGLGLGELIQDAMIPKEQKKQEVAQNALHMLAVLGPHLQGLPEEERGKAYEAFKEGYGTYQPGALRKMFGAKPEVVVPEKWSFSRPAPPPLLHPDTEREIEAHALRMEPTDEDARADLIARVKEEHLSKTGLGVRGQDQRLLTRGEMLLQKAKDAFSKSPDATKIREWEEGETPPPRPVFDEDSAIETLPPIYRQPLRDTRQKKKLFEEERKSLVDDRKTRGRVAEETAAARKEYQEGRLGVDKQNADTRRMAAEAAAAQHQELASIARTRMGQAESRFQQSFAAAQKSKEVTAELTQLRDEMHTNARELDEHNRRIMKEQQSNPTPNPDYWDPQQLFNQFDARRTAILSRMRGVGTSGEDPGAAPGVQLRPPPVRPVNPAKATNGIYERFGIKRY